jgi:KUP system potassium uptake protein
MSGTASENVGDEADEKNRVKPEAPKKTLSLIALAAMGIVFGDIGTSPLYTMKTVLSATGGHVDRGTTLGILSLLAWTLIIITSVKYVSFAMRIDNDGEGGILALMSLIGIKRGHRPAIVAAGLFGAALIYGDGAITPAISVLSALEGLHLAIPSFDPYVLPAAVVVLVALFALQSRGTSSIGKLFGPVMLTWFTAIALMGLYGIAQHPAVLVGLSPTYAVDYLAHGGFTAFALLGSVFLCVTGAEALYADMGHFGKRPIWLAWFAVVFPALILNYAGQAAIVLNGASTQDNIFYRLCPSFLLVPLILLATAATIIASQSIITGAFSMTRQAIQLGWMPRLIIKQTSEEGYGQIYVGAVNWLLMIVTVGLTLGFRKSDNLASAYGIAVSATMLMTSALLYIAMREIWEWSVAMAGAVAASFLLIDGAFFTSNLLKLMDGGWVPLALATLVFSLMRVWHSGAAAVTKTLGATTTPIGVFFDRIEAEKTARVEGTAVFLTRSREGTPPLLAWHVRQNRCLFDDVLIVTIVTTLVPRVSSRDRFAIKQERPKVWRVVIKNGFMDRLSVDDMLPALKDARCDIDMEKVVYYVGHESIVRAQSGHRKLSGFTERLFAAMERNQAHLTDVLGLPNDRVVEIGRRIEL